MRRSTVFYLIACAIAALVPFMSVQYQTAAGTASPVIIRWVTEATRKLHPSSDCFQGLGYTVKPLAIQHDHGSWWAITVAEKAP